jgi:hypothetical protein
MMLARSVAVLIVLSPLVLAGPNEERRHWAFQSLSRPALPQMRQSERVRTPIDAFVLAKLEAKGLAFSADAPPHVLVRRVYLDLLGLPPSLEEIDAFVTDRRPDAYERLIDRVLASPHFGERWGRHWLDGAGYVDVVGGDNDAATVKLGDGSKWRYRDYVVRSFNEDRTWKRFLTEQIAGDELTDWRKADVLSPDMIDKLVATGFLRTAADDTDENELNTLDIRHGIQQRTGEVMINNLLGLTLGCAKCHDHKYEPISQRDYYRIMADLAPAFNPQNWLQPPKRALPDKQKKPSTLQAVYDVGPPSSTHLLKRGDHNRPGEVVPPGLLSVLCEKTDLPSVKPAGATSGRRLALASWLTDADTRAGALAVRVRVNRIWHHLFGRGLVTSPDNFGVTGVKPTHPELLEWLSAEFIRQDGQLKPMLRMLMTSSIYRQASTYSEPPAADVNNDLLWRMRLRRLESEAVRDNLLAVSGRLDRTFGGPAIPTTSQADGSIIVNAGPGANRRSIYLLGRRNYHPTLLSVFDQPVMTTNCAARATSAVVLQPLTMLNDGFVREQANHLAQRIKRLAGDQPEKQVALAHRLVLGQASSERESALCLEYLRQNPGAESLPRLCQVLLNTSGFLYVP